MVTATTPQLLGLTAEPACPMPCCALARAVHIHLPHQSTQFLLSVGFVPGTVLETWPGKQKGTYIILGHLTEEVGT